MNEVVSIDLKPCRMCGRELPATSEHFPIRASNGRLRSECRGCHNKVARERTQQQRAERRRASLDEPIEEASPPIEIDQNEYLTIRALVTRLGISREKALNDIHKGILRSERGFGASGPRRFKYLISQEEVERYADFCAHGKVALFSPDACGCCGTTKGNILGDINEANQKAYGYLCSQCYRLIRGYCAEADRMRSAYEYLQRTRPRPPQKKKHSS